MSILDPAWEKRNAELWSAIEEYEPEIFVGQVERLAAELPVASPVGLFEVASAQDSTGHPELAVPLYRSALAGGLAGMRRRRATIQMASLLRNLAIRRKPRLYWQRKSPPHRMSSTALSAHFLLWRWPTLGASVKVLAKA